MRKIFMKKINQERAYKGQMIRDIFRPWPPTIPGKGLFDRYDDLLPNLSSAKIESVSLRENKIRISMINGGKGFKKNIHIIDEDLRSLTYVALSSAKGMTFKEAGELKL